MDVLVSTGVGTLYKSWIVGALLILAACDSGSQPYVPATPPTAEDQHVARAQAAEARSPGVLLRCTMAFERATGLSSSAPEDREAYYAFTRECFAHNE